MSAFPRSQPAPVRLLRLPEVIKKTGLGRDSIYRGCREGWFPKPVKLSKSASCWIESEIDATIESAAQRRQP